MKIALVQLDCNDNLWHEKQMPNLLKQAGGSDLVVFPECMPFHKDGNPVTHEKAIQVLEKSSKEVNNRNFIAGGYVLEGKNMHNRVYLVSGGNIKKWYDKQIVWKGEKFTPGSKAELFEWDGHKCVPLICADAGDYLSPRKVRMMGAALVAGAGPKVPIVICSYGGGLMTDYWRPSLREWSRGCKAPVVICGISGWHTDETYTYDGGIHPFGGGGSGVFWPNGYELQTAVEGIVLVDLEKKTISHKKIRRTSFTGSI